MRIWTLSLFLYSRILNVHANPSKIVRTVAAIIIAVDFEGSSVGAGVGAPVGTISVFPTRLPLL